MKYVDSHYKACSKDKATYYCTINVLPINQTLWDVRYFYLDGTLHYKQLYKVLHPIIGSYDEFFPLLDSLYVVKDGVGEWYFPSGSKSSFAYYDKGNLEGMIEHYYPNGQVKARFYYKEGHIDKDEMPLYFHESGKRIYDVPDHEATIEGGDTELNRKIKGLVQYPSTLIGQYIAKEVGVKLLISNKGELLQSIFNNDTEDIFKEEIKRVLHLLPEWIPAIEEGQNVYSFKWLYFVFNNN